MKNKIINHICYTVSINDLVTSWIEIYHRSDNVLVIYDAIKHLKYLEDLGFNLSKEVIYDNKIVTVQFDSFEDTLLVNSLIDHELGPYTQVWSGSELITDNIDK